MVISGTHKGYINQYKSVIKFGPVRLRALELIHALINLLYPAKNQFSRCMLNLVQGGDLDRVDVEPKDSANYGFSQARFINHQTKR